MKNFIFKTAANLYERIFQERISQAARIFIMRLGYVAVGYGFSAFCVFAFEIITGRILGPKEYGKYVLVASAAIFLHFLMGLGLSTAAVKYNAEKKESQRQGKIISTSYLMVLSLSFILALLYFAFSVQLSALFSIPLVIFRLAIAFAFFYTLYTLSIDSLKGLYEMKKLAFFRAGYGLLILTAVLILSLNKYLSFQTAVFSICLAYLVIFLLITVKIRKHLSFRFDNFWANKFLKFGLYAAVGNTFFDFSSAFNKIMVNRFLTTSDVGIYNAYYFSSIGIVVFCLTSFITVFFPTVSQYQRKEPIFKKIKQCLPWLFLVGLPMLFGIEWIILSLYGPKYLIDYSLMAFFSLASILTAVYGVYYWLFSSQGVLGVKLATWGGLITFSVNILFSLCLIPTFALYGAIVSLCSSYFIGIMWLLFCKKEIS